MKGRNEALAVMMLVLVLVAGCAKENLVRKDESPVKAPVAAAPAEKATAVSSPAVKVDTPAAGSGAGAAGGSGATSGTQAGGTVGSAGESGQLFRTIYFDYDSSTLSAEARTGLSAIADSLKQQKSVRLRIEGNCDERGSDEYNLALGERRAKAAASYLATLGIDEKRLATISYGKEKPAAAGHDEAAWAKNRRDDILIQK